MNQPLGRKKLKIDSAKMLKENQPVIGTGEWDDYQCKNFKGVNKNGIKLNDIVLVRDGKNPIALCQVTSDYFEDKILENKYKNRYYRKVVVLDFYSQSSKTILNYNLQKFKKKFIQSSGTLTLCKNSNATNNFIKEWYSAQLVNNKMDKKIELLKYKKQIILQGPPGTGKTREAELIAKEMLGLSDIKDLENNNQYKLVQFHPSYTYEDFVRGISAQPSEDGKGVLYKAENKTLSLFAQEAYKNYEQSTKTESQISYKDWINEQFDSFVDKVQDSLDNDGEYRLSDKVKLCDLDDSSFYYTGDSWFGEPKHRMKFSDIKEGFINNVVDAKSFKALPNTSGSAKQHYGYYYKVLSDFQNSIKTEFKNENKSLLEPKNYVLVIDEINRANLSSVLGELIYALEYREKAVESMYSVEDSVLDNKNQIILPPNLYIIGTMNTADRSVGHIDYAIRRRFAFVDVLPEELDDEKIVFQKELFKKVSALFINNYEAYIADKNTKLERAKTLAAEFRPEDVWLGHSYFIQTKEKDKDGKDILVPEDFNIRLEYEIKPILMEYVKDGILINTIKDGESEIKVEDYIKAL